MSGAKFACTLFLLLMYCVSGGKVFSQTSDVDKFVGFWRGTLAIANIELVLELHLEKNEAGELVGNLISVSQGNAEIDIDRATVESGTLTLRMNKVFARYTARIAADGETLEGTFSQGGDHALSMKRATPPSAVTHFETWRGTMLAGPQSFDFQVRLFRNEAGEVTGKLDSFSENIMGLLLEVRQLDDGLEFDLNLSGANYVGTYDESKTRLNGTWKQGPNRIELNFDKVPLTETQTEMKLDRPQTPQPEFPYDVEEVEFENENESVSLAGTLTLPKLDSPLPAVILITGSGPQDRDETIFGHKPFWVIADYLSRRGIAVLRYDDRGVAGSTGNFFTATSENFANDVEAAINYLKQHSRIDARRIGLIGHSEGGYIASMVAARNTDVAFIVKLAGPGVPGAEIIKKQTYEGSRLANVSPSVLEAQTAFVEAFVNAQLKQPRDEADDEEVKELAKALMAVASESTDIDKAVAQAMIATMRGLDGEWTRFFLKYDPAEDLAKVKCPVLALIGSKDVQVDADINLQAIENALTKGENPHFEVRKLEGLNHLFQTAETGAGSEYAVIEETFAPKALEIVYEWIAAQVKSR
ncbi:MAG TPA: alpha/beta hydrolase [Pirellulaceae bacterium]|nr:alpha/beta hydrolase [Pirellulaceae bacterium]HMP71345.1 alpha/beta hydrolase [Pirellulaceae bacterium]